jgi:hypothetical protein
MANVSARPPAALVEGQNVFTTAVVERPPAERPTVDSTAAIAEWLIGDARRIGAAVQAVDVRGGADIPVYVHWVPLSRGRAGKSSGTISTKLAL